MADRKDAAAAAELTVLHVGCGQRRDNSLHAYFQKPGWREIRLDIDPNVDPDIVASMTDMSAVESESVDAVYNSHALEHLFAHEVPLALKEFHRVLRPGCKAFLLLPDLEKAAELILQIGPLGEAYDSPSGPITPLDMIYGHRASVAHRSIHMQHKTGFTKKSIVTLLRAAGFRDANAQQEGFDLQAYAIK